MTSVIERRNSRKNSGTSFPFSSHERPSIQIRRKVNLSVKRKASNSVKDCVFSLHQNSNLNILYAKNNIHIYPADADKSISGYLSLLQNSITGQLSVRWVPNPLINDSDTNNQNNNNEEEDDLYLSKLQSYVFSINIADVAYLHCHNKCDSSNEHSLVFVAGDGVHFTPIYFPPGGHLFAFLSNMESGLWPHYRLEPPLYMQKDKMVLRRGSKESNDESAYQEIDYDLVFSISATLAYDPENVRYSPDSASRRKNFKERASPKRSLNLVGAIQSRLKNRFFSMGHGDSYDDYADFALEGESSSSSTTTTTRFAFSPLSAIPDQSPENGALGIENLNSSFSRQSLHTACQSMRYQLLSRVFNGWRAHCQYLKDVRTHLNNLFNKNLLTVDYPTDARHGVDQEAWNKLAQNKTEDSLRELYRLTYFGGVKHDLKSTVWPYLLGFYSWTNERGSKIDVNDEELLLQECRMNYENLLSEWTSVEAIVRERDKEAFLTVTFIDSTVSEQARKDQHVKLMHQSNSLSSDVFVDSNNEKQDENIAIAVENGCIKKKIDYFRYFRNPLKRGAYGDNDRRGSKESGYVSTGTASVSTTAGNGGVVDTASLVMEPITTTTKATTTKSHKFATGGRRFLSANGSLKSSADDPAMSDVSECCADGRSTPDDGDGGTYSKEVIDLFATNLHRIERDVNRCDRHYQFFKYGNLDKLQNVLCTYVWKNLHHGYVQGMCDLAAPLLVILKDEALAYGCFDIMMKRLSSNFNMVEQMDSKLSNIKLLLQVADNELYDVIQKMGDHAQFYFCYRWFLLDFKREFKYEDVFSIWETIWSANRLISENFDLFLALAMIETYRDDIMEQCVEFSDIIKFFNEMAEKHDAKSILENARGMLSHLQLSFLDK